MKKKMIAMMLAAACIGTGTLNCAAVNAAEQDAAFIMGDVNGDGAFGVSDAVLLQKWLSAVPDTHLADWRAADFCADNQLNVCDLTLMKRALLEDIQDPVEPPADHIAPLRFQTADDAIKEIIQSDLSIIKGYAQMFERFRNDGFIYHFTDAENAVTLRDNHPNAAVWLMPYDYFEDTGILYHAAYQGKYYQVYYYFTDPAYTASDLWDYMEQRLHTEQLNVVDGKYGIAVHSSDEQTDVSAYFAIDDTHYCKVRTFEPEDALMDFLRILNHEKLDIAGGSIADPVTPVTAQPIEYKNVETAIEAISNNDVNAYPEQYYQDYRKMFERFRNDGFIYQVTENEWIRTNEDRGTTLFPYARYEDIGVGCYVTFKGRNYHIMFYSADADVLAETDGIAAYIKKRMGRSSDKEIAVNDQNVSLLFHENGQCYANAFVDVNHYFDVTGAVSEEEMTEFLNAFAYEKTVF